VLSSGKVSKRHCALMVARNEVLLRDEGSTNGTFVNGTLIRKLALKPGDKVGVGEFVLELTSTSMPMTQPQFNSVATPLPLSNAPQTAHLRHESVVAAPDDFAGKVKFTFEGKVMPFFYGSLMKNEYRSIVSALFLVMVVAAVIGTAVPMSDLAENSVRTEAMLRAKVIAREVADRFSPAIASHAESQIDLSFLENEETVKMVVITDTNLQIIAPQARINQVLGGGREAAFAVRAAKEFKEGREKGIGGLLSDHVAAFVEPIKVTDPKQVKSFVAAMVVVSIDFSSNALSSGELGVSYGIGFLIAGILGFLAFSILMRLTMKPFEVLNDDLDQVLRGELPKVTHEFKIEELNSLWNNINSTVQRASKGKASHSLNSDDEVMVNWDQEFASVRALSEAGQQGFIAFDSKMVAVAMNPLFSELSGIRMDNIGHNINQVARDQAFISLGKDIYERVQSSPSRSALDEFEFSGVLYSVVAVGVGPAHQMGFAMIFRKKE
jgi:hypothetical protein